MPKVSEFAAFFNPKFLHVRFPFQHTCNLYKIKLKPNRCKYKQSKRCTQCNVVLPLSFTNCPCCNQPLRTKPRDSEQKDFCGYRDPKSYIE